MKTPPLTDMSKPEGTVMSAVRALFDRREAERAPDHLVALLEQLATADEAPVVKKAG